MFVMEKEVFRVWLRAMSLTPMMLRLLRADDDRCRGEAALASSSFTLGIREEYPHFVRCTQKDDNY
jgi:hypothetical protein